MSVEYNKQVEDSYSHQKCDLKCDSKKALHTLFNYYNKEYYTINNKELIKNFLKRYISILKIGKIKIYVF